MSVGLDSSCMLRYCAQRDPSLVWDQADKLPWDGTLAWQIGEQLWSVVTLLFYQIKPLKNGPFLVLPSSLSRD